MHLPSNLGSRNLRTVALFNRTTIGTASSLKTRLLHPFNNRGAYGLIALILNVQPAPRSCAMADPSSFPAPKAELGGMAFPTVAITADGPTLCEPAWRDH
jgi:hypothetical protein